MGCLFVCLMFVAALAVEFSLTVGIIYLITLCFGLTFSWKIAIGAWLVVTLLRHVFGGGKN